VSFPWLPLSWHLPIVLVAALTDLLDGASGRLLGACSTTGRVLDPVADKVFLTSVVVTLLVERILGVGEVLLVGLRDLAVLACVAGGVLTRDWDAFRHLSPTWLGKATTAGQFAFLLVLLVAPAWKGWAFPPVAALSGLAAILYLWVYLGRYRARK